MKMGHMTEVDVIGIEATIVLVVLRVIIRVDLIIKTEVGNVIIPQTGIIIERVRIEIEVEIVVIDIGIEISLGKLVLVEAVYQIGIDLTQVVIGNIEIVGMIVIIGI